MKPALTPDEWLTAKLNEPPCGGHEIVGIPDSPRAHSVHALAALALHGQPFGFTWDDVDLLRTRVMERAREDTALLASLADRIAALLAPREP